MRIRTIFLPTMLLTLAMAGVTSADCSNKSTDAASTEANGAVPHGITEGHDGGSTVWEVKPDGKVRALVKTTDGKPVRKDVGGTLWKGLRATRRSC